MGFLLGPGYEQHDFFVCIIWLCCLRSTVFLSIIQPKVGTKSSRRDRNTTCKRIQDGFCGMNLANFSLNS
jgi:hypothetical protein